MGVCLEWGVDKTRCVLINIYSKCDLSAKKRLWECLVSEREHRAGGAWCMVVDFNVVRKRDERRGVNDEASSAQVLEMFLFNNFLGEMELEDLNVLGRRFTWYHPNGRSCVGREFSMGVAKRCFRSLSFDVKKWRLELGANSVSL